nr:MAG: hypothetical protein [Molluscum contagiosum virus]
MQLAEHVHGCTPRENARGKYFGLRDLEESTSRRVRRTSRARARFRSLGLPPLPGHKRVAELRCWCFEPRTTHC